MDNFWYKKTDTYELGFNLKEIIKMLKIYET